MKEACEFGRVLKAWLDGELPRERAARVEGHLAGCAQCRECVADFRGVSRALKSAGRDTSRPPSAAAILQGIQAARREEALVVGFLKRVAAVAAAVLLVSLAALLWEDGPRARSDPDDSWREDVMEIVLSDLRGDEDL